MSSIAAVIHITGFSEDPMRAIHGLMVNRSRIAELHFIYPAYQDDEMSMYPKWGLEHRKVFEDSNVKVFFDASLNPKNFENVAIVVEVPPYCELKLGAFDTIKKTMSNASTTQTHFALETTTKLNRFSLAYGFLVVLTVLDWLWNRVFERNKLIQSSNVVARFVVKKGKRQFLPEKSFGWRIWNSAVIPKAYGGDMAVLSHDESGMDYMIWLLHNHANLGFGLWMFPFFFVWLILSFSWFSMAWAAVWYQSFLMGGYAGGVWLTEVLLSYLICGHYISLNYKNVLYLFFPIYFALFPFVLVYSKLSTPQKSWN